MKKDIFKGLVKEAPTSLVEHVKTDIEQFDLNQPVRKGMGMTPADRLNEQLSKGMALGIILPVGAVPMKPKKEDYDGALKNTHGEDWHDDNDKQVEEFLSSAEEIVERSMTQEELFLKAMGEGSRGGKIIGHTKSGKPIYESGHGHPSVKTFTKQDHIDAAKLHSLVGGGHFEDYINEEEMANAEERPTKDWAYEAKKMADHHAEESGKHERSGGIHWSQKVRKSHPMPKMGPSKKAPAQEKDPEQKKEEAQVRRDLGVKKSAVESALDSLIDVAADPYAGQEELLMNVHENSEGVAEKQIVKGGAGVSAKISKLVREEGKPQKQAVATALEMERQGRLSPTGQYKHVAKKSFVAAEGIGGMIFDFGASTGNEIADHATALLNQHGDPVQAGNASYQQDSFKKAIKGYVEKGEAYNREATAFGNIDKGWNDQLNTSMDQQVMNLYKQEAEMKDPSTPAVKNEFNKTTLNVGGDVVKATSETDAAVLEMMRSQLEATSEGGTVVDASAGGAMKVEIEI